MLDMAALVVLAVSTAGVIVVCICTGCLVVMGAGVGRLVIAAGALFAVLVAAIDAIFMYQYRVIPKSLHTCIWDKPHQPKKAYCCGCRGLFGFFFFFFLFRLCSLDHVAYVERRVSTSI